MAADSVYGPKDRARLTGLADTLTATVPSANVLGPVVADKLRTELPDAGARR